MANQQSFPSRILSPTDRRAERWRAGAPSSWASRRSAMLAFMAMLVLLMPVNYRAGAEADHPHAFFQGLIDLATGSPHDHGAAVGHDHPSQVHVHHHDEGVPVAVASPSPFVAASVPLAAVVAAGGSLDHAGRAADLLRDTTVTSLSPDLPSLTDLNPEAEARGAIAILMALLATLLAIGSRRRELPTVVGTLRHVDVRIEAPPPRIAPAS